MRVSWAAASHPGLRRSVNEDSFCTRPDLGLFVVADGMGGHVAGEIASRAAVESIENFIAETASYDSNRTWPFPLETDLSLDANRLKAGFRIANRTLAAKMASAEDLRGMATTVVAVLLRDGGAVIAHVGDSRIYLLRDGHLGRLTQDHSWVEEQVRAGTLTASAAREHPWRNVVTRALSGGTDPEVDIDEVTLQPGDRLLLCSDGLFVVVSDERLHDALTRAGDLQATCEELIAAANEGGGPDNVTVLVLQIDAS